MHANRSLVIAGGLLLSAAFAGMCAADDAAPAKPDLTGHWVLNEKASDVPRPQGGGHDGGGGGSGGRGAWGGGHGGRGGWGGGRGMRGGGDSGGAPGGSGEDRGGPGGDRGPGGGRMGLPSDMVVELSDSELVVSVRGLAVRRLEFGATPPAAPAVDSKTPEPAIQLAHWNGARIVAEVLSPRGGKVTDTWELGKEGKQLVIRTSLPARDDRPGMEWKRVYDRVEQQ